jgi:hypothetical protein
MSHYKSVLRISQTQCFRHMKRFALDKFLMENTVKKHAWCGVFCKEFCMKSAVDDCVSAHPNFCKQNCEKECFHIGKIPSKP